LPRRLHAHISHGLLPALNGDYAVDSNGLHYKLALSDVSRINTIDTSDVIPLSPDDVADVQLLYDQSYPGNWFDPRMLETGYYYAIKRAGSIVSVAGVHVYSQRYNAAALGNITTHPDFRGQGLSKVVSAKLCQSLLQTVTHIGLNVKADNRSALTAYQALGFEIIAEYEECTLTLQRLPQFQFENA
jgi:GNAT superfamily N-acetyltransferase